MNRLARVSISTRLFIAVLLVAAAAVTAAGIASHRSFTQGFLGYLNELALDRVDEALPRVAAAYTEHGSWDFLREKPHYWIRLMVQEGEGMREDERSPSTSDLTGAFLRVTLLDTNHDFVIGFHGNTDSQPIERPIMVDDHIVGWLALAPFQSVTEAGALRFEQAQLRARWSIFSVAILLAAAIAWWVSRAVLGPIRQVARATHQLAGGDYSKRVPEIGEDEVGQLSRDFNHLAATLERNEALRRDFMADIAHELRTPLGILNGELEALEDGVRMLGPETLKSLQAEVKLLNKLVDDVYDLALTDVAALAYRKENLDLAASIEEVCAHITPRLAARGLTLSCEVPPGAQWVFADAARMRQLLMNLLENSCRYTDHGGQVRVRLTQEKTVSGSEHLVLRIEDSAPGVAADLLPRLFDRFYRVEASRNRATGGTGLGLAICRNIVIAHDGVITAEASPLGGLAITISLPLARSAA